MTDNNRKLPLMKILDASVDYCVENVKSVSAFVTVNLLFLLVSLLLPGGYANPMFLVWLAVYYVFWCYFFRFYFNRKPYLMFKKICDSLVPSTKILFLTAVFALIFAAFPIVLPFLLPVEMVDAYTNFLRKYLNELDWVMLLILLLISPLILYRPFMAWISSVIGRSGQLKTAFARTEGNYWRFVAMGIVFNAIFIVFEYLNRIIEVPQILMMLVYAPLLVYFNVVIAKAYEFFFLEGIENQNLSD